MSGSLPVFIAATFIFGISAYHARVQQNHQELPISPHGCRVSNVLPSSSPDLTPIEEHITSNPLKFSSVDVDKCSVVLDNGYEKNSSNKLRRLLSFGKSDESYPDKSQKQEDNIRLEENSRKDGKSNGELLISRSFGKFPTLVKRLIQKHTNPQSEKSMKNQNAERTSASRLTSLPDVDDNITFEILKSIIDSVVSAQVFASEKQSSRSLKKSGEFSNLAKLVSKNFNPSPPKDEEKNSLGKTSIRNRMNRSHLSPNIFKKSSVVLNLTKRVKKGATSTTGVEALQETHTTEASKQDQIEEPLSSSLLQKFKRSLKSIKFGGNSFAPTRKQERGNTQKNSKSIMEDDEEIQRDIKTVQVQSGKEDIPNSDSSKKLADKTKPDQVSSVLQQNNQEINNKNMIKEIIDQSVKGFSSSSLSEKTPSGSLNLTRPDKEDQTEIIEDDRKVLLGKEQIKIQSGKEKTTSPKVLDRTKTDTNDNSVLSSSKNVLNLTKHERESEPEGLLNKKGIEDQERRESVLYSSKDLSNVMNLTKDLYQLKATVNQSKNIEKPPPSLDLTELNDNIITPITKQISVINRNAKISTVSPRSRKKFTKLQNSMESNHKNLTKAHSMNETSNLDGKRESSFSSGSSRTMRAELNSNKPHHNNVNISGKKQVEHKIALDEKHNQNAREPSFSSSPSKFYSEISNLTRIDETNKNDEETRPYQEPVKEESQELKVLWASNSFTDELEVKSKPEVEKQDQEMIVHEEEKNKTEAKDDLSSSKLSTKIPTDLNLSDTIDKDQDQGSSLYRKLVKDQSNLSYFGLSTEVPEVSSLREAIVKDAQLDNKSIEDESQERESLSSSKSFADVPEVLDLAISEVKKLEQKTVLHKEIIENDIQEREPVLSFKQSIEFADVTKLITSEAEKQHQQSSLYKESTQDETQVKEPPTFSKISTEVPDDLTLTKNESQTIKIQSPSKPSVEILSLTNSEVKKQYQETPVFQKPEYESQEREILPQSKSTTKSTEILILTTAEVKNQDEDSPLHEKPVILLSSKLSTIIPEVINLTKSGVKKQDQESSLYKKPTKDETEAETHLSSSSTEVPTVLNLTNSEVEKENSVPSLYEKSTKDNGEEKEALFSSSKSSTEVSEVISLTTSEVKKQDQSSQYKESTKDGSQATEHLKSSKSPTEVQNVLNLTTKYGVKKQDHEHSLYQKSTKHVTQATQPLSSLKSSTEAPEVVELTSLEIEKEDQETTPQRKTTEDESVSSISSTDVPVVINLTTPEAKEQDPQFSLYKKSTKDGSQTKEPLLSSESAAGVQVQHLTNSTIKQENEPSVHEKLVKDESQGRESLLFAESTTEIPDVFNFTDSEVKKQDQKPLLYNDSTKLEIQADEPLESSKSSTKIPEISTLLNPEVKKQDQGSLLGKKSAKYESPLETIKLTNSEVKSQNQETLLRENSLEDGSKDRETMRPHKLPTKSTEVLNMRTAGVKNQNQDSSVNEKPIEDQSQETESMLSSKSSDEETELNLLLFLSNLTDSEVKKQDQEFSMYKKLTKDNGQAREPLLSSKSYIKLPEVLNLANSEISEEYSGSLLHEKLVEDESQMEASIVPSKSSTKVPEVISLTTSAITKQNQQPSLYKPSTGDESQANKLLSFNKSSTAATEILNLPNSGVEKQDQEPTLHVKPVEDESQEEEPSSMSSAKSTEVLNLTNTEVKKEDQKSSLSRKPIKDETQAEELLFYLKSSTKLPEVLNLTNSDVKEQGQESQLSTKDNYQAKEPLLSSKSSTEATKVINLTNSEVDKQDQESSLYEKVADDENQVEESLSSFNSSIGILDLLNLINPKIKSQDPETALYKKSLKDETQERRPPVASKLWTEVPEVVYVTTSLYEESINKSVQKSLSSSESFSKVLKILHFTKKVVKKQDPVTITYEQWKESLIRRTDSVLSPFRFTKSPDTNIKFDKEYPVHPIHNLNQKRTKTHGRKCGLQKLTGLSAIKNTVSFKNIEKTPSSSTRKQTLQAVLLKLFQNKSLSTKKPRQHLSKKRTKARRRKCGVKQSTDLSDNNNIANMKSSSIGKQTLQTFLLNVFQNKVITKFVGQLLIALKMMDTHSKSQQIEQKTENTLYKNHIKDQRQKKRIFLLKNIQPNSVNMANSEEENQSGKGRSPIFRVIFRKLLKKKGSNTNSDEDSLGGSLEDKSKNGKSELLKKLISRLRNSTKMKNENPTASNERRDDISRKQRNNLFNHHHQLVNVSYSLILN